MQLPKFRRYITIHQSKRIHVTHAGTIESDTVKAIEFRRSPSGAFGALELENLKDGDIQNKQTWYSAEKIVLAESVLMIEMCFIS